MLILMKAEWSVKAGNGIITSGEINETIKSIIDELKPEAAYFFTLHGKRTAMLILDLKDASQIVMAAALWFIKFNADIDFTPVITPEDLGKAAPEIENAVWKYA
jgi:hypothetical protein